MCVHAMYVLQSKREARVKNWAKCICVFSDMYVHRGGTNLSLTCKAPTIGIECQFPIIACTVGLQCVLNHLEPCVHEIVEKYLVV